MSRYTVFSISSTNTCTTQFFILKFNIKMGVEVDFILKLLLHSNPERNIDDKESFKVRKF